MDVEIAELLEAQPENEEPRFRKTSFIPSSPDWPFPCIICGKRFEIPSHVKKHIEENHMYSSPTMCDICGKLFKTPGGVKRHKRSHTGEKPYKCSHCTGTFAQWNTWRKHELTHLKSNKEFQCFACKAYFDQERELESHTKNGPCSGQMFDCCGTVFANREEFIQHQIKRHRRSETKLYSCQYCNKVFSLFTDKRIHEQGHIDKDLKVVNDNMYQCKKCEKYMSFKRYRIHEKTCGTVHNESHSCDLCQATFLSRFDMVQHRKSHINAETKYPCNVCGKVLKSHASRYNHMKGHSSVQKYKCSYCEKGFVIRAHLMTHIRMHTGEKPFSCGICGKAFSHDQSRRHHEAIHTRPKAFKCSYCPKAFNSRQSKISHERFHTGEKPYQCRYCDQRFIRLGTLKCHERVHTGEKPFGCKLCDKSFAQSSTLATHMKTHTREKKPVAVSVSRKARKSQETVQEEWAQVEWDQNAGQVYTVNNNITFKNY